MTVTRSTLPAAAMLLAGALAGCTGRAPAPDAVVYARVIFIDATTNTVVDSIAVGKRPWGIALSPDGERLYTADGGTNTVTVIDIPRRQVIATVAVGEKPYDVLYVPPPPAGPSPQR